MIFQDLIWIAKIIFFSRLNSIFLSVSIENFWKNKKLLTAFFRALFWIFLIDLANIVFNKNKKLFLRYLQLHTYINTVYEIYFVSELILNVSDIVSDSSEVITLQSIRLFVRQSMRLELILYYIYWNNSSKLYTFQYKKILRVEEVAREFTQIAYIYYYIINNNKNKNKTIYQFCEPNAQFYIRKIFNKYRIYQALIDCQSAVYKIDYF